MRKAFEDDENVSEHVATAVEPLTATPVHELAESEAALEPVAVVSTEIANEPPATSVPLKASIAVSVTVTGLPASA